MGFPADVANRALIACNRCCCICHKFCGTKIELHHIKQKALGGEDTFENCIPLCFDCHADMGRADPKHPKGRRYTPEELQGHRDNWYRKVENAISNSQNHVYAADKKLFQMICDVFDDKVQYWLSEADLRGPYPNTVYDPLAHLLHISKNPSFEFLDVELEIQRSNLLASISNFLNFKALYTFSVGTDFPGENAPHIWLLNQGYIPRGETDYEKYVEENYKIVVDEGDKLNELASEVWHKYTDFVRQGRKLLEE